MNEVLAQSQLVNREDYKQAMSNPAVQEALASALEKLPKMLQQYTELEKKLEFVTAVFNDKDSLLYLMDSFDKDLPEVNVDRETLQAVATLINKLPKFAKYAEYAETFLDFGQAVISDKESIQYLTKGMESLTAPICQMMQQGASILEDVKKRADKEETPVGIFTLLKMLKDPTVQSGLQLIRAILAVIEDRKGNSAANH